MSGAEPCTGSNIEGNSLSGLRFALGAMPMLPITAAPRSVRMSPNRFEATTTSKRPGSRTNCAASASTWYSDSYTSSRSATTSRTTSSQNGMVCTIPLDFVAEASRPARPAASPAA
jgi:hypothetical protein